MDLIFATNNSGKLHEVRQLAPPELRVSTLRQAGITEELPEPFDTFRENAWSKAHYVFEKTGKICFAEDSGLVVPALNGAPGVFSARYAGIPSNSQRNNEKLLKNLQNVEDLRARYEATICLVLSEKDIHYFTGKCEGQITLNPRGTEGFGYDPLFIPKGYQETFGELPSDLKNRISHRFKAFKKLTQFLNEWADTQS